MSFGTKATLNSGHQIPTLGYGTWQSAPGEVSVGVFEALKAGYRHLDLAKIYENQKEVAQGLKKALAEIPGLKREDIFITSKIWNNCHHADHVEAALDDTLKELELDYLDMWLIHWPLAFPYKGINELFPLVDGNPGDVQIDDSVSLVETWTAMTKLPKSKARAIGVSNFSVDHLDAIIEATGVVPAVNQIERHPRLQQTDTLVSYMKSKGIHLTAYSAFGNNAFGLPLLVKDPVISAIAEKRGATPAQVILAWSQVGGHSVIPKSVTPSRIVENFQEVKLTEEDIAAINELGKPPKRFNVPYTANKPRWDINVFNDESEKPATHKVIIK